MKRRHLIPVSGKDSLATAIIQQERAPGEDYEYFFNPTGLDLPETLAWIGRVEQRLGKHIHRVGDDLEAIIYEQGILPAHKARYCTRKAKIFPMEEWIGSDPATVYYGIRADEHRAGYQSMTGGAILPVYPLKEEGYTLPMVWELVSSLDLMPPDFFWQSMYDMVVKRLGDVARELLAGLKPWERIVLFAWRSRPNCYNCFYMRLYEYVGLLEFHPNLFWHANDIEEEVGAKNFTIKQNWSLRKIAENAELIKQKRCIAICKLLAKHAQMELPFEDDEELDEIPDLLSVVPCGLFCGK